MSKESIRKMIQSEHENEILKRPKLLETSSKIKETANSNAYSNSNIKNQTKMLDQTEQANEIISSE